MSSIGLTFSRLRRRLAVAWRLRRLIPLLEVATPTMAVMIAVISYYVVLGSGKSERLLAPPVVALLLIANLVPIMGVMVLVARRVAQMRASRSELGGKARLHVRLVAVFSAIASVPTLLVVIFASLLFQFATAFWFSDKTHAVLSSAEAVAHAYADDSRKRLSDDITPMASDIHNALLFMSIDSGGFQRGFAWQLQQRGLSEAAIIKALPDGSLQLEGLANLDKRPLEKRLPPASLQFLQGGQPRIATDSGDRIEGTILLDRPTRTYLYISRKLDPKVLAQAAGSQSALSDYLQLVDKSRSMQLTFNVILMVVTLLILGIAIWVAMTVADRLVRPVNDLVAAARRVASGDLSARVIGVPRQDEIGTLGSAFNRMTRKMGEQTGALVAANSQLESRSAFIEAVLSGVTAGIISVDAERCVTLVNPSARTMLSLPDHAEGHPLSSISGELDHVIDANDREVVVQIVVDGEPRTLSVRCVAAEGGHVLTFDDITQRLADQRRAAWADVARRIAHEIKNPLTPIQLAAERLQRRYGKEVTNDPGVFEKLTQTIVRQVGDMRRIVDEFSSFARMPKPVFREEAIVDVGRQALFLHEVAHPSIRFSLDTGGQSPIIVGDRRQLGQALTNIVKNAVEAIEENEAQRAPGTIEMAIREEDGRLRVSVADNGPGLPNERERLTEPYMTTRKKGTGLGLAIVRKIVEDHFGTMSFRDRPEGGTIVDIDFNLDALRDLDRADDDDDQAAQDARLSELTRSVNG